MLGVETEKPLFVQPGKESDELVGELWSHLEDEIIDLQDKGVEGKRRPRKANSVPPVPNMVPLSVSFSANSHLTFRKTMKFVSFLLEAKNFLDPLV